jgi:hypothetical protein
MEHVGGSLTIKLNYSDNNSLLYRIAGLMLKDKGNNLNRIDFEGRDCL